MPFTFHPRLLCAAGALLALSPCASADDDAIATDRPDFVESSNVVGKGRLQIETSLAWDRSSGDGLRDTVGSTPTLLRYGVSDTLEVRLESDGRLLQRSTDAVGATRTRGYGDLSFGLKWHAMDAAGGAPSVGVLVHADLDSGSPAFRGIGVRPSVRVVAEWELGNGMSLGMMPGLVYERGDQSGAAGIFGIVVGKSLSDTVRSFIELSAPRIASASKGGTEAALTVGAAWLLSDNVQLDTAFSRGLNKRTPDTSFTLGLSVKL